MKPVHFRNSARLRRSSTIASFLLGIILITACSSNAVTVSSTAHPSSTANRLITTPTALSSASPTVLNLNAAKITEDVGSLRIQSDDGFQCPNDIPFRIPMDQLVLASNRTTYTQDEIAQMSAYVSANATASQFLEGGTKPPLTLQWVLGGAMDSIPGTYPSGAPCGAILNLTNTGSKPIQIPHVGVRLEGRPQQKFYQYRLIDICTLTPKSQIDQYGCTPSLGNNPGCGTYTASIQLGMGKKNDVFFTVPNASSCGALTIAPAAQISLDFDFSLASNIPRNLIYSITPVLTIDTAQGEQTISLSQLVSTLAFANVNQFSCYGLLGTTFVLEPSPVYGGNLWCM